jgi:hypothetical protein
VEYKRLPPLQANSQHDNELENTRNSLITARAELAAFAGMIPSSTRDVGDYTSSAELLNGEIRQISMRTAAVKGAGKASRIRNKLCDGLWSEVFSVFNCAIPRESNVTLTQVQQGITDPGTTTGLW